RLVVQVQATADDLDRADAAHQPVRDDLAPAAVDAQPDAVEVRRRRAPQPWLGDARPRREARERVRADTLGAQREAALAERARDANRQRPVGDVAHGHAHVDGRVARAAPDLRTDEDGPEV